MGLLGGSAGAAVALLVLAEQDVDITAGAACYLVHLTCAPSRTPATVIFGSEKPWSDRSREVAARLDFVERASEIAERRQDPAVLLVVGEDDDAREFAARLRNCATLSPIGWAKPALAGLDDTPQKGSPIGRSPRRSPSATDSFCCRGRSSCRRLVQAVSQERLSSERAHSANAASTPPSHG